MKHYVKYRQFTPTCPPQAGVNYLSGIWVQSAHENVKISARFNLDLDNICM